MKKIRTILVLALLVPAFVQAQDDAGTPSIGSIKLNAGVKLGINLARLNGTDWQGGFKTNLLGGLFANLHGGRFGVQVEGLFAQSTYTTGQNFDIIYRQYLNDVYDSTKQGSFRVSYLNIPVLLQYRFMHRVWILAGPQYSGIVSTKDNDNLVKDASGLFRSGTLSGVVGVELMITKHIGAGGRYVLSFTNENNLKDNTGTEVGQAWKRRDIQFHLSFTL